jgi:hypothetical protein
MSSATVENALRIIGITSILICGTAFLIIIIPLASIISYEIMLPLIIMDILLGLFVIVTLILTFSMVASIKTRALVRSRRRQSHLGLNLFVILFLIVVPFFTVTISNAYQEPNAYKSISAFDQTNWVHFSSTAWGQN